MSAETRNNSSPLLQSSSQVVNQMESKQPNFLDHFLSQWDSIHSHAVRHAYGYTHQPPTYLSPSNKDLPTPTSKITPKRSRADSAWSMTSSVMSPPSSPLSPIDSCISLLPYMDVPPSTPPALSSYDGTPSLDPCHEATVGQSTGSPRLSAAEMMKMVQQQAHEQLVQRLQLAQLNTLFDAFDVSPRTPTPPLTPSFIPSCNLISTPASLSCSSVMPSSLHPSAPPSSPVLSPSPFAFDTLPVEKYISIPLSEQECMEANLLFDELITMDES